LFFIAPSDPPQDFKNTSTSASSVSFEWKPPLKLNGNIEKYIITYSYENHEHSKDFTGNSAIITNLKAFTKYPFKIACKTNGGRGPFSDWRNVTTYETCKSIFSFYVFICIIWTRY